MARSFGCTGGSATLPDDERRLRARRRERIHADPYESTDLCGPCEDQVGRTPATQGASCIRELSPSLFSMLVTWVSTVRLEMNSREPISPLAKPSAMRLDT